MLMFPVISSLSLFCRIFALNLQAFEHLINRELICFTDNRGHSLSVEFRPVKLLISSAELHQGLRAYHSCPVSY